MHNVLSDKYRNKFQFVILNETLTQRGSFYADKIDAYKEDIAEIVAKADEEDRDLTEDELQTIEEIDTKIDAFEKQIKARNASVKNSPSTGRKVKNTGDSKTGKVEPTIKPANEGTFGFKNFGEFASTVALAKREQPDAVARFKNVATTYGTESNGADGGFLIPADFGTQIWKKVTGEGSLYSMCTQLETSRNSMTYPKDETTPWGSNGIQATWEGEGDQGSETKHSFETDTMRLNKLMCLIKVTEELIEDAPGLDSYIRTRAPEVMTHKINTAIINGNGVGKPLGILQSGSLLTLSKETSQDAGTFIFQNVSNMYARMYAAWRRNAVWLINQDVEPQLDMLAFNTVGEALSGSQPLYMPVGGIQDSPNGRLKSRPVEPIQACQTLGTSGDVIFADMKQYVVLSKAGGIRTETSMHLHFDQDIMTYKLVFRMTGKPRWNSTITPENGSNTLSWAVVMEDRD